MQISDLIEQIPAADYGDYDLKDPQLKNYLNELNQLCWTLASTPVEERPAWFLDVHDAPFIADPNHTESWSRTYEIAGLACISYLANSSSGDDQEIREFLGGLKRSIRVDSVPVRSNLFLQGLCHYRLGDLDAALISFQKAHSQYAPSGAVSPLFAYSRSAVCGISRHPELWTDDLAQTPASDTAPASASGKGGSAIVTTGNPAYVDTFFPTLLSSFLEFDDVPDTKLHLHVMLEPGESDLPDSTKAIVTDASSKLGSRFVHSHSESPLLPDMRPYFASYRFFMMEQFLEKYELVILIDIDMKVMKPLSIAVDWAKDYDLGFALPAPHQAKSWIPWLKTVVNIVSSKASDKTRSFWSNYGPIYWWMTSANQLNWAIDQNIVTELVDADRNSLTVGNTHSLRLFVPPGIPRPN